MHVSKKKSSDKWWLQIIRFLSWFSFRYWWFVWATFISCVIAWAYICNIKNSIELNCNMDRAIKKIKMSYNSIDSCCNCSLKIITPTPKDSVTLEKDTIKEIYLPADYILITYQFDAGGGKDLDTRTSLISPIKSSILGYCKKDFAKNIFWSKDNKGVGVESVYIDITKFETNDQIEILCKSYWFSTRNSGNMSLDIRAYKGGKMALNNYQFKNVGGEQVGDVISFPKNISMFGRNCLEGEVIGVVKYNRSNQTLSFE